MKLDIIRLEISRNLELPKMEGRGIVRIQTLNVADASDATSKFGSSTYTKNFSTLPDSKTNLQRGMTHTGLTW
ncbi:hypothetical protein Mapa_005866 [Marchantia paleacea]|nr:hypothetical protein Mapa_005866 [Marchantia paleacea]